MTDRVAVLMAALQRCQGDVARLLRDEPDAVRLLSAMTPAERDQTVIQLSRAPDLNLQQMRTQVASIRVTIEERLGQK